MASLSVGGDRARSVRVVAAAGLAVSLASGAWGAQITSNWLNAASGTWNVATNWSTNPVFPNNAADTYIAVINATGAAYTVTLNTNVTLDELTLNSANATLLHSGGTFGVGTANLQNGVFRLNGGTISGGTWNVTGGQFEATSSGGTLTNVQMTGDILVNATNSFVNLGGTTRFGAIRLQGTNADARLGDGYMLQDAIIAEGAAGGTRFVRNAGTNTTATIGATGSVTLAAGAGGNLNVQSLSGTFGLTNNGLIRAEAAGRTLSVATTAFTNNGTMEVSNGALTIGATSWSNTGTIAVSGGTLNLDGGWDTSGGIGTFNRTGGTINLGAAVNNTGSTFTLDSSTGSWNLNGGSITGGTVNTAGGSALAATGSGGTLTDVDFNGELFSAVTNSFINLGGTTRFDTFHLQGTNTDARLANGYVLNDAIVADSAAGGTRLLRNAGTNTTATIGATGSVTLAAGAGGNLSVQSLSGTFGLTNNGLIRAEAAGRTLLVATNAFTNNGTMEVSNGALTIGATSWSNTGTIAVSGGTLNLDGGWNTSTGIGTFNRTGGTINLAAAVNNAGNTFTLNNSTGSWNLSGGSISGGAVNTADGATLIATGSGGTLTDVDFNGELISAVTNSFINLGGTTRFDAFRAQGTNTEARLANGYVMNDAFIAEGAAGGTRFVRNAGTNTTATIGATGSVTLAAGVGGNLNVQSISGTFGLTNNGLIRNEAAGRTLSIATNAFTNNGMMEVSNGALTIGATSWSNAGTIAVSGGTLNLDGGWNTSAGIGTFNRTGGTINLGAAVNNVGGSFMLDATTGSWNLNGGSITGGTVNTAGGSALAATGSGGTLTDVDFNGELFSAVTNSFINLGGTTRFDTFHLQGTNTDARLANGFVLQDAIVADGASGGTRLLRNAGNNTTASIGATGSVTLAAGVGGNLNVQSLSGTFGLTNNGLIRNEAAGRTLLVGTSAFTNNGMVEVADGTLQITSTTWANTGTFAVSGGTLNLDGGWDATGGVGTFNRTGGTINLIAAVNNAGNTFALDNSTGSWNLSGGSISGGTINSIGGNTLHATGSGGTLTDVDFNGELIAAVTNSFINLGGTTRFDAFRAQGINTEARLANGYVLNDAFVADSATGGTRFLRNAGNNTTASIGATGSAVLAAGAGGNLNIQALSGTFGLTNNGVIRNEAAGRTLFVSTSTFVNNGTLRANAGVLVVDEASSSAAWVNHGDAIAGPGGTLRFVDGYDAAGSTGDLRVELAGALAANYGRINVTAPTSINGSDIGVDLVNGFTPDWGDKFTILTFDAGQVTGDFSSFVLPVLTDAVNWRWYTEVTTTSVAIGVRHTADVNRDNSINFADLNIIVSNFNTVGGPTMGDVNEDGFINFADLNRALAFFNTSAPVNTVPAPGGVAAVLMGLLSFRRRRAA